MANLILKCTEACNASCAYCDVVRKERTGRSMPLSLLKSVYRRVDGWLLAHPDEHVQVIWHGGEPLLLGAEYFLEAARLQAWLCRDTSPRIRHSIQTNLTRMTPEVADALQTLGIDHVGTSYDPLAGVRGLGRRIDSERYNDLFFQGLAVLREKGLSYGVIYVVTRRSLEDPLNLFHYLHNLSPKGGFQLHPVLLYGGQPQDLAITPEEYVDFLGHLFPYWWAHRHRFPRVAPFQGYADVALEGAVRLSCTQAGRCGADHVNIGPDGEVSQCGRSSDWDLLSYGHIDDKSLDEIFADGQRDELARRGEGLRQAGGDCADCPYWHLCHGGCPLDAWSAHGTFSRKTAWCEATRGFLERHFEPVTGISMGRARG